MLLGLFLQRNSFQSISLRFLFGFLSRFLFEKISRILLILSIFFVLSSCQDVNNCISADNYGEYDFEIIDVPSGSNAQNCKFDSATYNPLDIAANHGATLKKCLIDRLCSSKAEGEKQSCLNDCKSDCPSLSSLDPNSSTAPDWVYTSLKNGNSGLKFYPGSEVWVTVNGNVSLTDGKYLPILYFSPSSFMPNLYKLSTSDPYIASLKSGQSLILKFGGDLDAVNLDAVNCASEVKCSTRTSPTKTGPTLQDYYNFARRIAVFVKPNPEGHIFAENISSDLSGTSGVPFDSNPQSWRCDYNLDSVDKKIVSCKSDYSLVGYDKVNNNLANTAFPVKLVFNNNSSYNYIDVGDSSCGESSDKSKNCYVQNITLSIPDSVTIGDSYFNITDDAVHELKYRFSCPGSSDGSKAIEIKIKDSDYKEVFSKSYKYDSSKGALFSNTGGYFKKGFQIFVKNPEGCKFAIRLLPPPVDIVAEKSGLLTFSTVSSTLSSKNTQSCTIKGFIVNPSQSNDQGNYFEYDDNDPFYNNNRGVDAGFNFQYFNDPNNPTSYENRFFVRKGQAIRISSESFTGKWRMEVSGKDYEMSCSKGLAYHIEARPALLCLNNGSRLKDAGCANQKTDSSGKVIGCDFNMSYNDSTTEKNCQKCLETNSGGGGKCYIDLTCKTLPSTEACNIFSISESNSPCNATGCDTKILSNASVLGVSCVANIMPTKGCSNGSNLTPSELISCQIYALCNGYLDTCNTVGGDCDKCLKTNQIKAHLEKPILTSVDEYIPQCFDFEDYKGSIRSFKDSIKTNQKYNLADMKGAKYLEAFDSSKGYGSINSGTSNYLPSFQSDSIDSNLNYFNSAPINITKNSRVGVFILNKEDFLLTGYSKDSLNKKIILKPQINIPKYSGGKWLEAKICNKSLASCDDIAESDPDLFNNIVKIKDSISTASSPVLDDKSVYNFDDNGILRRSRGALTNYDCKPETGKISTSAGVDFYCFKIPALSGIDYNKLSMGFKIKDPEPVNETNPECFLTEDCDETCKNKNTCEITNLENVYDVSSSSSVINVKYGSSLPEGNGFVSCKKDDTKKLSYNCSRGVLTVTKNECSDQVVSPIINSCRTTCNKNNVGLKRENSRYVAGSDTTNKICTATEMANTSSVCTKQYYCTTQYANNSGSYFAEVKTRIVKDGSTSYSGLIQSLITPVNEFLDGVPKTDANGNVLKDESGKITYQVNGQSMNVYKYIISNPSFQVVLKMSLILFVAFYGLFYVMGLSEFSYGEVITRIVKIGLVYMFLGARGWEWFQLIFVEFFKDGVNYLTFSMASSFDDSVGVAIKSNQFYDKSILFRPIDKVIDLFISPIVQKKISALFFEGWVGWIFFLLVYWGFYIYIVSIVSAVMLYITAQMFISILFAIAPVFFVFLLYSRTKSFFDNWVKQLISFSLQQIFLMMTLGFFSMMFYEVLKMILNYEVCFEPVWTLPLGIIKISLLSAWKISESPSIAGYSDFGGDGGSASSSPSLFSVLFLWLIASLGDKFINFMSGLASTIAGSNITASSVVDNLKASAKGVAGAGFDLAKNAAKSKGFDPEKSISDKLGSDGKSEKERKAGEDNKKKEKEKKEPRK